MDPYYNLRNPHQFGSGGIVYNRTVCVGAYHQAPIGPQVSENYTAKSQLMLVFLHRYLGKYTGKKLPPFGMALVGTQFRREVDGKFQAGLVKEYQHHFWNLHGKCSRLAHK